MARVRFADESGGLWALVPAKSFGRAKSRLGAVLAPAERRALARTLLEHVLAVLAGTGGIERVAVVTDGREVAQLAARRGALALFDGAAGPLGLVVDAALRDLAERGARRALVAMSDLPGLARRDVERMVALGADSDLVLAPDARDEGTNALLVSLPARWPSAFGRRRSFARHAALARETAMRVAVLRTPGLARDLDEARDL